MTSKRDNAYYTKRLLNMGRKDLLAKIESGAISVYEATIRAGIRKKTPVDNAEVLTSRWNRLGALEKRKFAAKNFAELVPIMADLYAKQKQHINTIKDQK